MNILAFDTTGLITSIALKTSTDLIAETLPPGSGSQAQSAVLIPKIQEFLDQTSLTFQDLDIIGTPTGPGSFTGIRLGLATAKGFEMGTKAAIFAPTTLMVAAHAALHFMTHHRKIIVALDTKREDFYMQSFLPDLMPLSEPCVMTFQDILKNLTSDDSLFVTDSSLFSDSYPSIPIPRNSSLELIKLHDYLIKTHRNSPTVLKPFYVKTPVFIKQQM
jgi:tRNA threonylcarbamoyladenosine biosynthesis protein TsaB